MQSIDLIKDKNAYTIIQAIQRMLNTMKPTKDLLTSTRNKKHLQKRVHCQISFGSHVLIASGVEGSLVVFRK